MTSAANPCRRSYDCTLEARHPGECVYHATGTPVARVKVWDEAGDLFIDEPCYRIPGKRGWFFTVPIQIGDGEVIQFEVQDD